MSQSLSAFSVLASNSVSLGQVKSSLSSMADGSETVTPKRIIAVAVDDSEWSEQAFECE